MPNNLTKSALKWFLPAAVALALTGVARAEYPERAIKVIVPWAAGGDTDVIFRPFATLLQKELGQPVVIANVGGASGTVGEREAAGAAPDGYTLFGSHDFIHSVYFGGMTDIKYSNAFEPVCMITSTPSVITVGAKTPWKTFKELVADAKKRPGDIVVGASLGSTSQYSIAARSTSATPTSRRRARSMLACCASSPTCRRNAQRGLKTCRPSRSSATTSPMR